MKYHVPYDKTSASADSTEHASYSEAMISYDSRPGDATSNKNITILQVETDYCLPLIANSISFTYKYRSAVSEYQSVTTESATITKNWKPEYSDIFSIELDASTFLAHAKFYIDYTITIDPKGYT